MITGFSASILIPVAKGLLGTLGSAGAVIGGGSIMYKKFMAPPPLSSVLESATGKSFSRSSLVSRDIQGNGVSKYVYKIPAGLSVEDMNHAKSAIRDKLDCDVQVWAEEKNFVIELAYNPIPKKLNFDKEKVKKLLKKYECAMYLGEARRGPTIIDFTYNLTPHLLFGGPTGGGKSNLLNEGICGMSYRYTPEELNFVLIDLKDGVELGCYADLPHVRGFCETIPEAEAELQSLLEEIPRRNQMFKDAGVKKLTEYNSIMEEKLPRILVIADEFAQFNNIPEKKYKMKVYSLWEELLQKGRSAGVHVVVGTQVADADVFPKQVKGNIDARFGFRFSDPQHSKMITGGSELTTLPEIPGRGMFKLGNRMIPTQVPRIEEEDIEEIINLYSIESRDEFEDVIELEEEQEIIEEKPEGIETLFQTEDSWRKS